MANEPHPCAKLPACLTFQQKMLLYKTRAQICPGFGCREITLPSGVLFPHHGAPEKPLSSPMAALGQQLEMLSAGSQRHPPGDETAALPSRERKQLMQVPWPLAGARQWQCQDRALSLAGPSRALHPWLALQGPCIQYPGTGSENAENPSEMIFQCIHK